MLQIVILALLQQGPAFAREVVALFGKKDITPADWENLFKRYKTPGTDFIGGADVLAKALAQVAAGKGDEPLVP